MSLPTIQYVARPGIIDLGWGHPEPSCLPVEAWAVATEAALRKYGWQSMTYGYANGPAPLVEWLAERLGRIDGRAPVPPEIFVTAGASQALELVSGVLAAPGSAVVVDVPTYHIALRILRDRGVELLPAPADEQGIDPEGLAELLQRLGSRVSFVYLVPTHANPTGRSLPEARRRQLVSVAARASVPIVEDDTYRELSFVEGTTPDSLWSRAEDGVVRLGSFSKTVGPGLRLGWLTGPPAFVERLAARGFVDSGGGVNHTTAMAMAEFGASGEYDRHLRAIRDVYGHRRDVLAGAVRPLDPAFAVPDGGWFLWLTLPVPAAALLPEAERLGVSFLPGSHFYATPGGGERRARLAFSMLDDELLEEGARRLVEALASL